MVHMFWVGQLVDVACPSNDATTSPLELRKFPPITLICCPGSPLAGSNELITGSPLERPAAGTDVVVVVAMVVGVGGGAPAGEATEDGVTGDVEVLGAPFVRDVGVPGDRVGAGRCEGADDPADVELGDEPVADTTTSTTTPIAITSASAVSEVKKRGAPRLASGSSRSGPVFASTGRGGTAGSRAECERCFGGGDRPWLSRARCTAVSIALRARVSAVGAGESGPRALLTGRSAIDCFVAKRPTSAAPSRNSSKQLSGFSRGNRSTRSPDTREVRGQTRGGDLHVAPITGRSVPSQVGALRPTR